MSVRFYVNSPLQPGEIWVEGPEAHHIAQVMRASVGDPVCLFNGDGSEYSGEIRAIEKKRVLVEVSIRLEPQRELPHPIEIAAPLPRGDRADFLIEKLTELGVHTFTPITTRRCVDHSRHPKLPKFERAVTEASKQCGRNVLMRIGPLTDWKTLCAERSGTRRKLMAHRSGTPWRDQPNSGPCLAAVGPEGGWMDEEVEWAQAHGWEILSLGERVYRVETAAIALAVLCGAG